MKLCLIAILLLTWTSCQPGGPVKADDTSRKDSLLRQPPQVKSLCLDTAWMREHDITFTLVRTPNILQWTLRYKAPAPPSDEVTSVTYLYKATADTACNHLDMQLISIELTLAGGTQSIPVKRHVIHAQEGLLTPDVTFNDFNFDGFRDFSVYAYTDSDGKQVRRFYLYNEKLGSFVDTLFNFTAADSIPRESL